MIDRIKLIIEYYNLSPASFSEQIGINRSNLTHLFSGRNQPSLELAKKILHCFPDIKTEWLIMGVGEMFQNKEEKELVINIQNSKKQEIEQVEPDLFTHEQYLKTDIFEEPVAQEKKNSVPVFDSQSEIPKKNTTIIPEKSEVTPPSHSSEPEIARIIFFYSDNSFEIFHPNK